jgi:CBS domain-containing protein
MKVRDLMTANVDCCDPTTSLTDAAMAMWRRDCGVVPVVQGKKLVGVITDRDICIATATRHEPPEQIPVGQVMRSEVFTCRPEEDVHDALDTMREHRVRRLPVVDALESIVGMLSLNDVIRRAEPVGKKNRMGVPSEEVLETLKAIGAPRRESGPALPAGRPEAVSAR